MNATAGARTVNLFPIAWLALCAIAVALLIWWWNLISRGPIVPAAWVPFVLPLLLAVRAVTQHPVVSPLLVGLVLGLSLAGATGRGALFVLVGHRSIRA